MRENIMWDRRHMVNCGSEGFERVSNEKMTFKLNPER